LINLNESAFKRVKEMIDRSDEVGVSAFKAGCGATIVDAGINSRGSYEAGRLFAEACLGGLGSVSFAVDLELSVPSVVVKVANPSVACLASQYAGWALKSEGFYALGSGPARSLYGNEPLYTTLGYRETSSVAVLAIESSKFPPDSLLETVAACCKVDISNLYVLIASTNSLAGSIQIVSRVVETALHKLFELGYDVSKVLHGFGTCPIPPLPEDFMTAMGWTNDAVLYGGKVWITLRDEVAVDSLVEKLPSSSSSDYGLPFLDLFKRYNYDFYQVDPMLFSPAVVTVNNLATGHLSSVGRENVELLRREWFR